MKKALIAGAVVLALAACPVFAGTSTGTKTFASSELATTIDPAAMDEVDFSTAEEDRENPTGGSGDFLILSEMNALDGLGVITFNAATGSGVEHPDTIRQNLNVAGTKYVEFETVSGLGNKEDGYNYGGYSSGGRVAISGDADYDHLGTIVGSWGEGTGTSTCMYAADVDIVGEEWYEWIDAVGLVMIGKGSGQSATAQNPKMTVTYEDRDTAVQSTAWINDGAWLGGTDANNAIFFGYQAPENCKIVRVVMDSLTENTFAALDDLAFNIAPEPGTMALLGIGGLSLLIRRKRS